MSTVIIITIIVVFILILAGAGFFFYKKKTDEKSESSKRTDETESEQPSTNKANAEVPTQSPSSSITSDDIAIGDSTVWNREGKLICGTTSPNKQGNLFCTDYSIDNKFKSMKKSCLDIDVDQSNKRIFCVDQATKKAQFLTVPSNGLTEHKDDATWNVLGNDKFRKISVNMPNIIGLGDNDQKVYRYSTESGWTKMGDLVTSEIAALSKTTNVGYILAPNSQETNAVGFRTYGYGIQGSPSWYPAAGWSGTKVDAGSSPNPNQPVVCHINKVNDIYCQTTSSVMENIKPLEQGLIYDNVNISDEKDLFLTTNNKDVYYIDLQTKNSQGLYPGTKISGLKFTKIAA